MTGIKLIVGLGNPGPEYEKTRHNAGTWFVEFLAQKHHQTLRLESKFNAHLARLASNTFNSWLAVPSTYMNHSGQAVGALARFYQLKPEEILIAHDELDFPVGQVRLKEGGGTWGA